MSVLRIQLSILKLFVIESDLVNSGTRHKFVPIVHLLTQRPEDLFRVLRALHYRTLPFGLLVVGIRKNGQVVLDKCTVGREFHHLRVDEYEFKLRRVLSVKK